MSAAVRYDVRAALYSELLPQPVAAEPRPEIPLWSDVASTSEGGGEQFTLVLVLVISALPDWEVAAAELARVCALDRHHLHSLWVATADSSSESDNDRRWVRMCSHCFALSPAAGGSVMCRK